MAKVFLMNRLLFHVQNCKIWKTEAAAMKKFMSYVHNVLVLKMIQLGYQAGQST